MAETWTVAPILRVADVRAAAEHYRDVLGFDLGPDSLQEDNNGATYAVLSRHGIEIHLGRSVG